MSPHRLEPLRHLRTYRRHAAVQLQRLRHAERQLVGVERLCIRRPRRCCVVLRCLTLAYVLACVGHAEVYYYDIPVRLALDRNRHLQAALEHDDGSRLVAHRVMYVPRRGLL